jgi:hypothetical protein
MRLATFFAVTCLSPALLMAGNPPWWASRNVISIDPATSKRRPADDYAAVNQGQLKNIAVAAVAELNANLPGGAGTALTQLAATLSTTTANTSNYATVNLGQVKTLAQPFYDRLIAAGYIKQVPWAGTANPPNDYAMANIGQVKNLFSFDVTYHSDAANPLPDWWQIHYFGALGQKPDSPTPSGDEKTLLQAFQQGVDPLKK